LSSFLSYIQIAPRQDSSLPIRIRNQRNMQQHHTQQAAQAEIQNGKKTIPVVFRYPASPKDKEALLTGSFTNWKEMIVMVKRYLCKKTYVHNKSFTSVIMIL
jgi:hypothetical protein